MGAKFYFTVPLEIPHENAIKPSHVAEAGCLRGVKALIVDDNRTNRRILSGVLRRWQMLPTAVEGGVAALAELSSAVSAGEPYALILTDMHMPAMDGFTLVEQIREKQQLTAVTVMMLTSGSHKGDLARCQALGLAAYLLKPVRESELQQAILRALNGERLAKRVAQVNKIPVQSTQPPRAFLRILVAEDNLVNQRLATRLLEKRGHQVVLADNGRQALDALTEQTFDLLLMDVQMPQMDGLQATAAIRQSEAGSTRHLPIVALTANAMKGDREKYLLGGMDGYLAKPIRTPELDEILEMYMDHDHRNRRAS